MAEEVVDQYVAARLKYFKKLKAEADALIETKFAENRYGPYTLSRDEVNVLRLPNQVMQELAYGLDYAMEALKFYALDSTWEEVPEKTYAADDKGMKARVALARIDPV